MRSMLLVLCLLAVSSTVAAEEIPDRQCLDCHGVPGYAVPRGEQGNYVMRNLHVDGEIMADTVHGELSCVSCHDDIEKLPHGRKGLKRVDCVSCHLGLEQKGRTQRRLRGEIRHFQRPEVIVSAARYTRSIHADDGRKNNADCATCHTAHYVFASDDPRAATYRERSPRRCGACHSEALEKYRHSVHGAALQRPWKGDSATCSDCHSAHQIEDIEQLGAVRLVTENCGGCHEQETASYMGTTHGQLAWLGYQDVPRCATCHRGHDTRAMDDNGALMSVGNRLEVCRDCHEEAGAGIVNYHAHGNTREFDKYPLMWLTAKGMIALVVVVLIFFYSHTLLWLYREYRMRPIKWRTVDSRTYRFREKRRRHHSAKHFRRFSWPWRVNHWTLVFSVMTLVLTGMAVLYPETAWAMAIVDAFGGPGNFTTIHHYVGLLFIFAVSGHAALILYKVYVRKVRFDWFGPDSLLPRWKDWEDMKAQFRWFFGKGEAPRFDRWTYWEKFDYWAVYWGAIVIGTSGLLLWFSDFFLRFLPGWVFNVAAIAHGVEAFLAVMTLFVVHFFNNHFRPSKFPLDTVMFTGSWDLEEFKEERPAHYERLLAAGRLDDYLVAPPSRRMNIVWHAIGFTLLTIGVLLLILVLIGFKGHGIV